MLTEHVSEQEKARAIIRQNFECFIAEGNLNYRPDVAGFELFNALPGKEKEEIYEIRLEVEDAAKFAVYLNQANPHPFIVYERDPLNERFKEKFAGRTIDLEFLVDGVNGWVSYPKIPATKFDFTAKGPIRILAS